jgi:hypothetical protein
MSLLAGSFRVTRHSTFALISATAAASLALTTLRPTAQAHERTAETHRPHDAASGPRRYTVGLFGDMPYGDLGKQQYPSLLADLNDAEVAFSIFDGDLKAGGDGPCTDDNLYLPALDAFGQLSSPLIFVPGDNDWTDCWGRYGAGTSAPGADDPIERLAHERDLFFSTPYSLGQTRLRLTRESSEGGAYSQYKENVRWKYGPVVFLGLNVQGSNDNYPYAGLDGETRSDSEIDRQRAEELARKAANLHWVSEGFAYAKRERALGVMIVIQADLNFDNEQQLSDPRSYDAYPAYIDALRSESLGFSGQVVLVHGDSHYFKIDMPLNGPNGGVVGNFTRVETFGSRNTHWVAARIDADDPRVFAFVPRLVPANLDQ